MHTFSYMILILFSYIKMSVSLWTFTSEKCILLRLNLPQSHKNTTSGPRWLSKLDNTNKIQCRIKMNMVSTFLSGLFVKHFMYYSKFFELLYISKENWHDNILVHAVHFVLHYLSFPNGKVHAHIQCLDFCWSHFLFFSTDDVGKYSHIHYPSALLKKSAAINGKKVLAFVTSYKPSQTIYYTFINRSINPHKIPNIPFTSVY